MIIYVDELADPKQLETLKEWLNGIGVEVHSLKGENGTILGLLGETQNVDIEMVQGLDFVKKVVKVKEPYKSSNRKFHPNDTVIEVGKAKLGGGHFAAIAGPCSVESTEQICGIAKAVKEAGATMLRGGAFKPRTSPYSFQGLRSKGIELLLQAKQITGMAIVSEIMDIGSIDVFEHVDVIQIGARNMQNFELLKEIGRTDKVILLKRGLANTLKEFLMSAEYIMASGNEKVILCERGIRTFETATRNTLDISAIPMLKKMSHLPVIVDPSHAAGRADLVRPLALAAVAAGADGIMVEVHNDPVHALCDGPQSIKPEEFQSLMGEIEKVRSVLF